MAGLLDAQAILAYLGVKPFDGTPFYRATGFVDAGEPVEYPYLETLKGEAIWAQPMILGGESLAKLTRVFSQLIIETNDDHSVLRFRNFLKGKRRAAVRCSSTAMRRGPNRSALHEENAAAMQ